MEDPLMVDFEWRADGCLRQAQILVANRREALLCAEVFSVIAAAGGEAGAGKWIHSKIDIWGLHKEETDD